MKKRIFKILIVLMTVSILGLGIVQMYWLNQAFEAKENEFNSRLYKALEETVQIINQEELDQYYRFFEKTRNTLQKANPKSQIISSQIESDSASVKYVYMARIMVDKIQVPLSGKYHDSLNVTELYSSDKTMRIKKDSSMKGFQPLPVDLNSEFSDGSYTIERFARVDAGNKPISKRINLAHLDSVFNRKLIKWKTETPFSLAVIDAKNNETALEREGFQKREENFQTALFYDRNNEPNYLLSVYFPNKKNTIFSTFSALFILTVLFTLFIIGVYIFSIVIMMRQRKISQLKTDFMNNMTHEFKTPIATISVAADALKSPSIIKNAEKIKYYAGMIKNENRRMNQQVEMVLRMSQLERREMKMDLAKTSMNKLVQESVESIRLIVENRNGTIFEKYDANKDELFVDTFHMNNLVLNVLDNANKYSPEAPQISIQTYNENKFYVIKISDKGIGMSKNVQNKIFEKFYREETGNIHNVKGHGLGLSYVKSIIDMHDGEIIVESVKDKGTSFYIKLPLN